MKKIISLALALMMIFGMVAAFTSCGGGEIIVHTNAFFAPFEYYDGTEIKGVDVEIMKLVGEKLGKKIREAQLEKVNYILIIGDKEAEQGLVSVRHRSEGDLGTMTVEDFKAKVLLETAEKRKDK